MVAVMEMATTSEICSLVWTTVCQKKVMVVPNF